MNKTKALVLGVITIWPTVYWLFFTVTFGYIVFFTAKGPKEVPVIFTLAWSLGPLTILGIFALIIFYSVHLYGLETLSKSRKALWAVALVLGSVASMPAYWYLHVWKPNYGQPAA